MASRGDSTLELSLGLRAGKGVHHDLDHHALAAALHPHGGAAAGAQQQPASHHQGACLAPAEIYEHIAEAGGAKPRNSLVKEVTLGVVAGTFIGFGFATCMLAAGQWPAEQRHENPGLFNLLFGAYGFPVGLSMCVINGASLFTSNIAYMAAAWMEGRAAGWRALLVVCLSYFTNLAGCLFLVQLMISGDVFAHREAFTVELALKKTSQTFGATVTRGILCNWLVCMAVWQGNAAQDVTGKLLGIWFPISAFVTCGYEHCIANMFVIPLAMRLGAPITLRTFLVKNLIPATIGNVIGGGVFVAMAFSLAFGSWERCITAAAHRLGARLGCGRCLGGGPPAAAAATVAGIAAGGSDSSLSERAFVAELAVCPPSKLGAGGAPHPAVV